MSAYCESKSRENLAELLAITSGALRALAFFALPIGSLQWRQFRDVIDEIADLRTTGYGIYVKGQFFSTKELAEAEARIIRHADGGIDIRLPILYPWIEPPDKNGDFPGTRADAVFRTQAEKDAVPDAAAMAAEQRNKRPWWMPENYQGPLVGEPAPLASRPEYETEVVDIPW